MTELALPTGFIEHFHWQRPWWLLAIAVSLAAIAFLWRQQSRQSSWQQLIPQPLLQHLIQGQLQSISRLPLVGLGLICLLGSLAMAGPSWEKIPQPVHKSEKALIVLLDLSPSMLAQDIKPSRLVRARLKLIDFLKAREEGLTALIAFAGEAHVITPLSDDTRTITSLVPALSPNVMPLAGSNPEMAVELALQLFEDGGLNQGEILLITDGLDTSAIKTIQDQLNRNILLSILGVGTDSGAPIPINNGGFARDKSNGIVLAKLNSGELQQLSRSQGGKYRTLSATDADIKALAQQPEFMDSNPLKTRETSREFDLWQDRGPWLALLILPLLLLGFRRGWLLSLMLIALPNPQPAYAFDWQDLWQTPDQQGQALLQQGRASEAAKTFKNKDWVAGSHYQAEEFEAAAETYAEQDSASSHYNRGNALAKSGQLEEAVEAYRQALQKNPELEDARFNQKLVEELLNQQQQQQQNQQGDSQENSDEQSQQQNQSGQGQDQQDQSQQDQNQQQGEQQDSERKNHSEQQPTPEQSAEEQQSQQEEPQQSTEDQPSDEQQQPGQQQAPAEAEQTPEQKEQQQALEQYLRKVPDDPSGLMRKKFEYQYHQRRKQYQQGTWQPPANNATERW